MVLMERADVSPEEGLVRAHNIIHGHLGAHRLPWNTPIVFRLQWSGEIGESFVLRIDVASYDNTEWPLAFKHVDVSMTNAEQNAVISLGVTFPAAGKYVFRASTPDDEITVMADLSAETE